MSQSYRDQSPDWGDLAEGERQVWTGRPSVLLFARKLLIGLLIGIGSIVLALNTPGRLSWRLLILLAGLPGWLIIIGVVIWHQSIKYVVTTEEVYMKKGILLWKQTSSCRVNRVQNRTVSRSFVQGLLSVGDVELATAGTGTVDFVLKWIPDPEGVKRQIARLQDDTPDSTSYESRPPSHTPADSR